MREAVLIDVNGFLGWCGAEQLEDGNWIATVWFERKSDHAGTSVPAMKHTLKAKFGSEREAVQAAVAFGDQCASENKTGL